MAEKLEDLNLPNTSVYRIVKEALPDAITIGKDAKSALSRAASVFILYVTSEASKQAQKANRKTLMGTDVIEALEELEFEEFIEPLQEALKKFKEDKQKSKEKSKKKATEGEPDNEEGEADAEEEVEEDDESGE